MIKIQQRNIKWIILILILLILSCVGGGIFWFLNNNNVDPGQSNAAVPAGYVYQYNEKYAAGECYNSDGAKYTYKECERKVYKNAAGNYYTEDTGVCNDKNGGAGSCASMTPPTTTGGGTTNTSNLIKCSCGKYVTSSDMCAAACNTDFSGICNGTSCPAGHTYQVHYCSTLTTQGSLDNICVNTNPQTITGSVNAQQLAQDTCKCVQVDLYDNGAWVPGNHTIVCPDFSKCTPSTTPTGGTDPNTGGGTNNNTTPTLSCNVSYINGSWFDKISGLDYTQKQVYENNPTAARSAYASYITNPYMVRTGESITVWTYIGGTGNADRTTVDILMNGLPMLENTGEGADGYRVISLSYDQLYSMFGNKLTGTLSPTSAQWSSVDPLCNLPIKLEAKCTVSGYGIQYASVTAGGDCASATNWNTALTGVTDTMRVCGRIVEGSGNLMDLSKYSVFSDAAGTAKIDLNALDHSATMWWANVNGMTNKTYTSYTRPTDQTICSLATSSWTKIAATANYCTGTPTIVNNSTNTLVATVSCAAGTPTYTWQKYINGVWTVVAANSGNTYPMINPMSGDYQVQVNCPASGTYTATSNACNDTYNQPQVTTVNTCVTDVTLSPATGTVPGTTLTRNAATCKSGVAPVYTWTPSGPSSTATTTYTPTAAGTYTVTASCPAGVVNDINYSAGTCPASSTLVAPKYCWKCNPTTGLYELKGTNTACTTGQISTNTNTAPTTPACTQNPVCPATTVSVYSGDTATLGCLVGTPSSATVTPTCTSTQTVQYTCANGASSVQCSYTCNPKPIAAVCTASTVKVTCGTTIKPSCKSGTSSQTEDILVNSSGSYTCQGINGGSNATCDYSCTPAPVNGVCTASSVQVTCGTTIKPSCKSGTPSQTEDILVNSSGSYTCKGTNNGANSTCNYACVKGNLSITKTVANKSGAQVTSADFINNELYVANNGTVEFTVTVKNSGQAVMKSPIEVTDTYDSGLKYYSFYNGGSSLVTLASKDEATRTLVVRYGGDLAVGASFTYKVKMYVQTLGTYLKNNVYVKSPNQPGGTPCTAGATSSNETTCNDNSANAQVKVIPNPDLTITKRVLNNDHSAAVPVNGSVQKTFEIEVRNVGKGAGTGKVIVNDKMDAGMTFVSATGTDWVCTGTVGSQSFRCVYKNSETTPVTIPANGVNGSVLPKITVVVSVNVSTGVLFNTATVSNDIGTNCTGGTPHTDYLSPIEESSKNNCSQDYVSPNFSPTAYTCGDLQSTPWTSNAAMQTYQKGSDVIFKVMLDGNNGIPKVVIKDATGIVIAELLNGVRSDQNTNGSYPLQSASYNFTWSDITADNGEYTAEVHIKVGSADYVKSTVNKCTLPFKVVSAEISVLKSSLVVCNDRDVLIQYDVAIVNDGNIDATGVDVVDTLDSKFQSSWLNSDMEPLGTLSNNSTLSWLDQSIKAGVTHHYTYSLSLPIAVARYGVATDEYPEFDNTVVVSGDFGTSVQDILKTTVTCQPPVVVDGRCSTTQNQCLAGTVQDITSSTWKCVGENGGATVTCTAPSSSSSSTTTSTCNPKNQNCSLPNTSNTDSGGNIWIIAIMLLIVSSIYGIRFSMKSKKNTSLFEKDM
jgi:uncharacterized repeat protein (TIGR01451 family)